MLSPDFCKLRQSRLLNHLQEIRCDAAVLSAPHHVYYFTGHLAHSLQQSAVIVFSDGRSILFCANSPVAAPVDDVRPYVANKMSTLREDQPMALATMLVVALHQRKCNRIAIDASVTNSQLTQMINAYESLEPHLWQMRRLKDPDELSLMKKAIDCCHAMYDRARQVIEPGIPEIEVYAQLHHAAVAVAGEPLSPTYLGNDYACGVPGGPARGGRVAKAGQLYILDLGPAYRGYFSDNARTFAVNKNPTDAQHAAHQRVTQCLRIVEQLAKPGVRCRDLFTAVDGYLKQSRGQGMNHHLGHGVGLYPHEFPHLNPHWNDTLMEGEVFTAEPGEYSETLAGGIRIENQYLVTKTGVQNLLTTPEEL